MCLMFDTDQPIFVVTFLVLFVLFVSFVDMTQCLWMFQLTTPQIEKSCSGLMMMSG